MLGRCFVDYCQSCPGPLNDGNSYCNYNNKQNTHEGNPPLSMLMPTFSVHFTGMTHGILLHVLSRKRLPFSTQFAIEFCWTQDFPKKAIINLCVALLKRTKMQPPIIVPTEKLSEEPYPSVVCFPSPSEKELQSRLQELRSNGVTALEFAGQPAYSELRFPSWAKALSAS